MSVRASKRDKAKKRDYFLYERKKQNQVKHGHRGPCGKICHKEKGIAESALKNLETSGRLINKDGDFVSYHCPRCDAWHIGHNRR